MADALSPAPNSPVYVIQFAHQHLDFRQCEFDASLTLANLAPSQVYSKFDTARPFVRANFPSPELAREVCGRCVLIKAVYVLLHEGADTDSCVASVQPSAGQDSWKVNFETFAWKFSRDEQSTIMKRFIEKLGPKGSVSMKSAAVTYAIIHEYAVSVDGSPLYPRHDHSGKEVAENANKPPLCVMLTEFFCVGNRELCDKYKLTKRSFLGPTSMDNELSLIMCTAALVVRDSFVFDPFVGTGSILFSAAVFGAHTHGTDIDIRILRGKATTLFDNFTQANLPPPDVFRADNSMFGRVFKTEEFYDAIVTDPPYGIRAGARKSGTSREVVKKIEDDRRDDHIPQTQVYAVCDVMCDLLDVAAKSLKVGGRLVYIIPSIVEFDEETDLPRHPCLKLKYVCYQPLQLSLGRRMVVMVKEEKYDESRKEEYKAYCWKNGSESADKVANLRDKLLEISVEKKRLLKDEGIEHGKVTGTGAQVSRKKMKKLLRNQVVPKDRGNSGEVGGSGKKEVAAAEKTEPEMEEDGGGKR
jgi:tRNA (guanine10-N2)-methyltransferase